MIPSLIQPNTPPPLPPNMVRTLDGNIRYVFFQGYFGLSNFHIAHFYADLKIFNCVEQYYQWAKAVFFGDLETAAQIMTTDQPIQQKALGRNVRGFNSRRWADACEIVILFLH